MALSMITNNVNDPNCPQDYQYMFGDDLLVAPVLEPGLTAWRVYLPGPETWVGTCSTKTYIYI